MLTIRVGESLTGNFWERKYFISIDDNKYDIEYTIGKFWTLKGAKKLQKEIEPLIEHVNKERAFVDFIVSNEGVKFPKKRR